MDTDTFSQSAPVDPLNFSVSFGGTRTVITDLNAVGYGFLATWGASPTSVQNISFTASAASGLAVPGPFISIGGGTNVASLTGICDDFRCGSTSFSGTPGAATLSAVQYGNFASGAAAVPLPATGVLAGLGFLVLAAFAAVGRRKRAAPRVA